MLQTVIPNAMAIRRTCDLIPILFETLTMSGIPSTAIVSFTKNAESNPKPTTNAINIKDGLCLAFSNIFIDTSLSTPDLSSAETILNMPKRNYEKLYVVYIFGYKIVT